MNEDAAYFMRITSESGWKAVYNNSGNFDLWGYYWGSVASMRDSHQYYFVAVEAGQSLYFEPRDASLAPGIKSIWSSDLPLVLSFEDGGTSDPNSDKLITIMLKGGKTLNFIGQDEKSYPFKSGVVFKGKPLEFYAFLNENIIGRLDFLTKDVKSVNLLVKGLSSFVDQDGTENDILVFNLALEETTSHYTPLPRARLYRSLEYINIEELTVVLTDALDQNRAPRFEVGISDVTLHFREIWNNPFRD